MAINQYKELVATTAGVSTILQFMSGGLVCHKFINKGTADNVSGLPFIAGFLSCSLWLRYSYMIDDATMSFVNLIGSLFMFSYTAAFYMYTTHKKSVLRQLMMVLVVITLAHVYCLYETDEELAKMRFGFFACCMAILFTASPLANLAHVLRVKSTENMPLPIITTTWIVSIQWYIYGVIINDNFIQYPNLIGCLLATFQLLLFIIYPSRPKTYRPIKFASWSTNKVDQESYFCPYIPKESFPEICV